MDFTIFLHKSQRLENGCTLGMPIARMLDCRHMDVEMDGREEKYWPAVDAPDA